MPAVSEKQRRYLGAAYGRKKAGKAKVSDPKMSAQKFKEFLKKNKGKPHG